MEFSAPLSGALTFECTVGTNEKITLSEMHMWLENTPLKTITDWKNILQYVLHHNIVEQ